MKSKHILITLFPCIEHQKDANDNNREERVKLFGWTPLLFFVSLAITFGTAIPVGYFLGVMNTPTEFIKVWSRRSVLHRFGKDLNKSEINVLWASYVAIFAIGAIPGSTIGAWCSNKFGRKGCILQSSLLLILAGILLCFCRAANSVEMLLAGRLLGGVAGAFMFTAFPTYLLEIVPAELCGTVGVFCSVGVTFGIVVAQVISLEQILGNEANWHICLSFYTILTIIFFVPCYWFPESPRWLYIIKGDQNLAKEALRKLRGPNAEARINKELAEMEMKRKAELAKGKSKNISYMSVFRDPQLLLPLIIVCSFAFCQQLSGINAIFYYSVDIFTKAGYSTSAAAWMNFGAGFLNLILSIIGAFLMANCNRRPLMMTSSLICSCSLFATAFALYYVNKAAWLPIACIIFGSGFILAFPIGLGPIPTFIASELFEVEPRSVAMSFGSMCAWICNLVISMGFPLLQDVIGAFAFLPCSVTCFYVFLFTWKYLPETRGRDASEVKPLIANGLRSRVRN